jgi:hypothetical protein
MWPFDPRCVSGPTEGTPVWRVLFPNGHVLAAPPYRLVPIDRGLPAKSKLEAGDRP